MRFATDGRWIFFQAAFVRIIWKTAVFVGHKWVRATTDDNRADCQQGGCQNLFLNGISRQGDRPIEESCPTEIGIVKRLWESPDRIKDSMNPEYGLRTFADNQERFRAFLTVLKRYETSAPIFPVIELIMLVDNSDGLINSKEKRASPWAADQ